MIGVSWSSAVRAPRKAALRAGQSGVFAALVALAGCDAGAAAERDAGEDPAPDASRDGGRDASADSGAGDAAPGRDAEPDPGDAEPDGGDAGCKPFVMPSDANCAPPPNAALPTDLRCTGLYGDFERRELACGVLEYKPALELWSDGAEKRRFASIPEGEQIDVSDPDEFIYPDGTQFWKEFRVEGTDGRLRLAETRLLRKDQGAWLYTSYVWSEDETGAEQMDNETGVPELYDTGHVVPNRDQCKDCHSGRKDYVLGWDPIMLGPGAEGVTREMLVELGLIADDSALALSIPGSEVERAALGYLHANCGVSCHNENPEAPGQKSGLFLRLEQGELDAVRDTDAVRSGVDKAPDQNAKTEGTPPLEQGESYVDIRPGDPRRSLLLARQLIRGFEGQMPRIGTNDVDDAGVEITRRWIESMTPDAGYPSEEP